MMYVDDTVIFLSTVQMLEMEVKLNMELNLSEFMVFGTYQRLHRQDIDGTDITLEGEAVKHSDNFKYLGVVLDSTLTFDLYIDYVKKKVSKILGIFSRIQLSLTIEASNQLYKLMILPILNYCCVVLRGSGKGNEEELECLQRCGGRIVLTVAHLSKEELTAKLAWGLLKIRREKHVVKLIKVS